MRSAPFKCPNIIVLVTTWSGSLESYLEHARRCARANSRWLGNKRTGHERIMEQEATNYMASKSMNLHEGMIGGLGHFYPKGLGEGWSLVFLPIWQAYCQAQAQAQGHETPKSQAQATTEGQGVQILGWCCLRVEYCGNPTRHPLSPARTSTYSGMAPANLFRNFSAGQEPNFCSTKNFVPQTAFHKLIELAFHGSTLPPMQVRSRVVFGSNTCSRLANTCSKIVLRHSALPSVCMH